MQKSYPLFKSQLKQRLDEVFAIEQNDLGFEKATVLYKRCTAFLKTRLSVALLPISLFIAIILYIVFGPLVIRLVSVLQYGF